MKNIKLINTLFEYFDSKEEILNYWKEYPYGFTLLIDDISDFETIFELVNKENKEQFLLPIMRVANGDDILCISNSRFCTINPYELGSKKITTYEDIDQIWYELIYPYIMD